MKTVGGDKHLWARFVWRTGPLSRKNVFLGGFLVADFEKWLWDAHATPSLGGKKIFFG